MDPAVGQMARRRYAAADVSESVKLPGKESMSSPERPGAAVKAGILGSFGAQTVVHLRAGFERSQHPMLIVDDQRHCITGNAAACDLLGIAADEVPWRSMDEFTPPDGKSRLAQQWDEFLVGGAAEGWYELLVRARGTVRVEFSAVANVMPARHLTVFVPPGAEDPDGADEPQWAPVAAGDSDRPPLTERERQIVTLVAAGGNSGDIARALFLSPETVKSHAQNAMAKLGARTRAHAVAIALVTGQVNWSISALSDSAASS